MICENAAVDLRQLPRGQVPLKRVQDPGPRSGRKRLAPGGFAKEPRDFACKRVRIFRGNEDTRIPNNFGQGAAAG